MMKKERNITKKIKKLFKPTIFNYKILFNYHNNNKNKELNQKKIHKISFLNNKMYHKKKLKN